MNTQMKDSDSNSKRGKPTTVRFHPFDELMLAELMEATGLSSSEIVTRAVRYMFEKFTAGEVDIGKLPPVDPRSGTAKGSKK